ncbi:mechanosensitive ion channel family protein [Bosea sp. (in: a-proteobacteria)]|uniref:mechanosensitive ion channel family protein n=1 Tax=Bosea sp. (in: a-proteobacteria) TaxID=1871050 RepID=UPI0025C0F3C1|nr:mechanosensitive ion channel family protein [Bosea sp. (in: a-proteobacteria)]MBR3194195.1 mechanosensitive ion channel family protein [Bosea sp. (in: a-proteobacteria)]
MVAMRNWLRAMALCGAALLAGTVVGPAAAQQAAAEAAPVLTLRGDETPETVRKLVDALSAGGRRVEIRIAGKDEPKSSAAASVPAGAGAVAPAGSKAPAQPEDETPAEAFWGHFVEGVSHGLGAVPRLAQLPEAWRLAWAQNRNGVSGIPAGWRLSIGLVLALAIAGLFRLATAGWFARRLRPEGPEFTPRLIASSWGGLQDLMTLGFCLGVLHAVRTMWLPETDLAHMVLRTIANGIAIGAGHLILGRFLLSPGAPERRIMPLPRAERAFNFLAFYGIVMPLVLTATVSIQHAAGPAAVVGMFALVGIATTLFKAWWFIDARHDLAALILGSAHEPGPTRRVIALTTGWLYAALAVLIWMVGNAASMMEGGERWAAAAALTQFIIVLAPILAVGITSLMACRQAHAAATGEVAPLSIAVGHALRAAAGGAIWAGGFYLLARLWAGFLFGFSSEEFAVLMQRAGGVAALAFGGWVAIVFLRSFFDAYTPKPTISLPGDEDAVPHDHVPSRLATVLPVLRGVVLAAAIGLTALVLLSRLGVDIGPLLAGFGILGLAFSFGSQALVRDIVSGFFFMLEDAFRVGEYVDTGRLKGTVEKISLRSMQLRHQSGQVHTVPFGQVQSLTNASRDWATVKFNVRLDHSADIEKARKTIKKIGLALLEDPEYGPHFIAPLKMQGVADITDAAIVIRLKFTAKPNQASMLQREALKRVYRGLIEAEVPFASNAVTVKEGSGKSGAAAIAAVPPPTPLVPAAE